MESHPAKRGACVSLTLCPTVTTGIGQSSSWTAAGGPALASRIGTPRDVNSSCLDATSEVKGAVLSSVNPWRQL